MAKLGLALMMLFGVVHAQVETDVHTDEAAMIQISKGTEARHLGVTFSADEGLDDGVEGRAKCRSFQCPAGLVPKAMGLSWAGRKRDRTVDRNRCCKQEKCCKDNPKMFEMVKNLFDVEHGSS